MSVPIAMKARTRLAAALALGATLTALFAFAVPGTASAERVQCAGTFRVLHDDHIGRLTLPKGNYAISILASGRPTCARAAVLFGQFLQDYDGRLQNGWRVGAANSTFLRGQGVGFHVRRLGPNGGGGGEGEEESGGGGTHPVGGSFCPATFRVLDRDRIGALQLPAGRYWVVLLQRQGLTCPEASEFFARFLDDTSGALPSPWVLQPATASFRRGPGGVGFRVKPVG